MEEENNQDNQKTIVSFVVGLLIGGLIVWAFSGPEQDTHDDIDMSENGAAMEMDEDDDNMDDGEDNDSVAVSGEIAVPDQEASSAIAIESATYPVSEGWVGVRTYENQTLTNILGVVRFSESQGLVPDTIQLQTPTISGQTYAVVVYEEDGDFDFSLAGDRQLDTIFDTFVAE